MHAHDPPPDWLTAWRREVGARIRNYRRAAGLSQEQLAGLLYMERRTIHRLEAGATSPPLDRILHIARVLEVSPASLLPDE
ncbi:helix-turn-helix domain-containing protein [Streptomyces desertarenae]|uniref:Helix-turn-helix domain-containing protein n=1 Tax=Streptomyces desertarenae TaxID=2666184 RepID=A0ABW4PQ81_9ACTN